MTCWIEYCNDSILIESSFTFVRSNTQILKDESADAVKGHGLERKLMSASVDKETKCPESFVSSVFGRTDRKTPDRNTVQQIDSGLDLSEIHDKTRHGKDKERFVPMSELKKRVISCLHVVKKSRICQNVHFHVYSVLLKRILCNWAMLCQAIEMFKYALRPQISKWYN